MTDTMKTALAAEIDLIRNWLVYENADELEPMITLADAQRQIDGMTECMDPDDPLPESLKDPATMLTVWNYCIPEHKRWTEERREETERPNREYLLKTWMDGILQVSIKTGKQIADIYEMDQIAGIYANMEVWDIRSDPVKIDLLALVEPILDQKRWMEQEYRDYCDAVNEYGLDFEGSDE